MEKAIKSIPWGFKIIICIIIFNILFKEFTYVGPLISTGEIFEGGNLSMVANHGGIVGFVY